MSLRREYSSISKISPLPLSRYLCFLFSFSLPALFCLHAPFSFSQIVTQKGFPSSSHQREETGEEKESLSGDKAITRHSARSALSYKRILFIPPSPH